MAIDYDVIESKTRKGTGEQKGMYFLMDPEVIEMANKVFAIKNKREMVKMWVEDAYENLIKK